MQLPEWLNNQVWQELETIEENKNVQYITSVERIGIAKGMAKGVEKGRVEGRVEGQSRLLRRLLERRFGALPSWATEQLSNASEQQLEAWGEAILTAPTLEAVFN
jgi:flagellar biosynthesis/type III secretory pathway protein FliH